MHLKIRPAGPASALPAPAGDVHSVASGVRVRVLLPLAAAMVLMVVTFVSIFVLETRQRQTEGIVRTAASIEMSFHEQSEESVQVMRSVIELLLRDAHLEAAVRNRDRARLLSLATPILEAIASKNGITHFYFIRPDRTMLLRVHAPARHGDKIERFVLKEAQRTGKPAWGNEQGPLGTFTLRVVYPWVSRGEVIGYLELGIEFEDIIEGIKNTLGVNIFTAMNKSAFDRANWIEAQAKKPHPIPWDEFPKVVVLRPAASVMPAPIKAYLGALREEHGKRTFEIAWDDKVAQTVVVPFADLRERTMGELVVVRDITAAASRRHWAVIEVAIAGVVIGGGLMLFFHGLLGRVQRDVAARTERLAQAQRVLTAEQFERQRAERELTVQRERNELLEARSRIVEQLAAAKEAAEAALRQNEDITRELRAAQSELLATARQAGMAEIATNVLHNVGNVLNSVNVSAGLVTNWVRASKLSGLAQAARMLSAHAGDLGDYLTRDDKGKLLPDYLGKVAAALAAEHSAIVDELAQLSARIEHIKQIVATQQSYAGAARLVEPVQVRDLVEDALRMNEDALERHGVTVERQFSAVPVLALDRHRLLQILVNLISNAKHAMDAAAGRPHELILSIDIAGGADKPCLRICVADNGEGIAPENLTRIFHHGFSTRKNGHGFGLHSCVLAAREMHGSLTAHSDGPGRGARFTLALPIPAMADDA